MVNLKNKIWENYFFKNKNIDFNSINDKKFYNYIYNIINKYSSQLDDNNNYYLEYKYLFFWINDIFDTQIDNEFFYNNFNRYGYEGGYIDDIFLYILLLACKNNDNFLKLFFLYGNKIFNSLSKNKTYITNSNLYDFISLTFNKKLNLNSKNYTYNEFKTILLSINK